MQYTHLVGNASCPAPMPVRFRDSRLIVVKTSPHDNAELIEQARVALRASSPGVSLLRVSPTARRRQDDRRGSVPLQWLDQPWIYSRLLTFPAHELLGHIALRLLAQGLPASALNTTPANWQPGRISSRDLLLVLPSQNRASAPEAWSSDRACGLH